MSKIPFVALSLMTVVWVSTPAMSAPYLTGPTAAILMQTEKLAADPKALQELLERISKLETEVERLKNGAGQPKGPADGGGVLTLVETAHLGMVYPSSGQSRFVAIQLIIANTTGKPVTLTQDQITAEIDGEIRKLEPIPADISGQSFQHKNQGFTLQTMQPEKSRTVPAGGQISFWLVFSKLPLGNTIPKFKLKLSLGETKKEIDVNAGQRAILALDSQRPGARLPNRA